MVCDTRYGYKIWRIIQLVPKYSFTKNWIISWWILLQQSYHISIRIYKIWQRIRGTIIKTEETEETKETT